VVGLLKPSAACLHPVSHFGLGELAALHLRFNLEGNQSLDSSRFNGMVQLLFPEEIVSSSSRYAFYSWSHFNNSEEFFCFILRFALPKYNNESKD
jgi:hypothetical protein